jgi:hypothetical protein
VKEKYIDIVCPICGKTHKVIAHDVKRRKSMLCRSCSARLIGKTYGSKSHPKGEFSPNWKGGKTKDGSGYIMLTISPDNPFYSMSTDGRIREHRLVMAQFLGRCLISDEVVHHKNGDKTDNRIENLELLTSHSHYPTLHSKQLQKENNQLRQEIKELENELEKLEGKI